jgi:hypothetical protein
VKLQKSRSRKEQVQLVEGKRSMRYYELVDFNLTINPRIIMDLVGGEDEQ